MRFLLLTLFCAHVYCSFAQSEFVTSDTLWIHRANENDEDISSFLPIIKTSANPVVANAINNVIQLKVLGFTLTEKHMAELLKPNDNPRERQNFNFTLNRFGKKMLRIDIGIFSTISGMSLNGYYNYQYFFFDAVTGAIIPVQEFFTSQGLQDIRKAAAVSIRKDFFKTMQAYKNGFAEKDILSLNQECECDCIKHIEEALCNQTFQFELDPVSRALKFSIPDCDWMNPREHKFYTGTVPLSVAGPMLSQYGKNAWLNESGVIRDNSIFRLWKGMVGKIPIHFLLNEANSCALTANQGSGQEVYDKYGTGIAIAWSLLNNGTDITLKEISPEGQVLATISARINAGRMLGTWEKADGSKKLPFEATVATK